MMNRFFGILLLCLIASLPLSAQTPPPNEGATPATVVVIPNPTPGNSPTTTASKPDDPAATPSQPTTVLVIPTPTAAAPSTPATSTAPVPILTDDQKDAKEEQKEIVSRLPGPNELIEYFQSKFWQREYEKAYACIDWGAIDYTEKTKRHTIFMLDTVLSRLESRDVSDFPSGDTTTVQSFHSPCGLVELEFTRGDYHNWSFANRTLRDLDRYYNLLRNEPPIRHSWLLHYLPEWSLRPLFGVPTYRIVLLVAAFFLGFVLKYAIEITLYYFSRWTLNLLLPDWDRNKLSRKTWLPIGLLLLFSFWFFGLAIMMPNPEGLDFLHTLYAVFAVMMVIWMSFRVVDLFALWLRQKMRRRDPNIDIIFFPLFTRTTKLLILCIGFMVLAQAFQWSVVGLVSGMGIGGIAVAFAAKETIANLFGSVTVLADRPFVIGDWIKTGDIEGTVEGVGMRSTRIRTFYNSLVTVPNNNLTTAVIDNMGARYYRRFRTFLSVPLDMEPERIEAFCEGIRELIRRHPYTRKDLFHVYLHEFKPFSLDILLNVFFVCPDTAIEFRERGRLISDILRLSKELNVRLALPTQIQHNITTTSENVEPIGDDPVVTGRNAAIKVFPLEE